MSKLAPNTNLLSLSGMSRVYTTPTGRLGVGVYDYLPCSPEFAKKSGLRPAKFRNATKEEREKILAPYYKEGMRAFRSGVPVEKVIRQMERAQKNYIPSERSSRNEIADLGTDEEFFKHSGEL